MRWGRLLLACCLWAAAGPGARGEPPQQAPVSPLEAEADLLIAQLGHADFVQREAATERLLQIGLPAMSALARGQQHLDREIRFRAARIAMRIGLEQRRRRVQQFLDHQDSAETEQLPGWARYQLVAGDTPRSRALFAKMLQCEWDLLAQAADRQGVSEALAQRCTELELARTQFRQSPQLASVAALLLLAGDEEIAVPDAIGTKLYVLCNQVPSFRQSLETDGNDTEAIRGLVGAWVGRGEGTMTGYYCLNLAMRYGFAQGAELAARILAQDDVQTNYRECAILAIAKLGSERHKPLLEDLLDDPTVCQTRHDPKSQTTTQTQIRDVALAGLIHLSGSDPRQFGFTQLRANSLSLFVTATAGFSSEQQRLEARQKWGQYAHRSRHTPANP